ncbi:hypothetical protein ES754_10025 [Psychrobacter frigidicola]|uniref:Uncharacterized protein n=1 Tax=Psychrobacter frigidicola TaxID=45611 RepID=A0A5C7A1B1_9GAMM|nr:protein YgfX [Psychrobacter frigidicola]TXD96469.1 hypothetical protein ES754_10025 [Psychrobacter frigidicola]
MTQLKSLRIDTPIKLSSYLRTLLYIILSSGLILLAWLAKLSLGHYVLILVITASVVSYLALSRPIVLHLSQPPLDQRIDQNWQVLMRTNRGDALWQADLFKVHRYPLFIHFEFTIIEPYQRALTVTVFRDQVTDEQWRELNILASVSPITAT